MKHKNSQKEDSVRAARAPALSLAAPGGRLRDAAAGLEAVGQGRPLLPERDDPVGRPGPPHHRPAQSLEGGVGGCIRSPQPLGHSRWVLQRRTTMPAWAVRFDCYPHPVSDAPRHAQG